MVKPHGLRGEVVVELITDVAARVAPGSVLTTDRGPLEVVASRAHQRRYIVAFAGVQDREGSEALRGTVLRAEPVDDPDALWVHDLIGRRVVDVSGRERGTVVAVQANPASDLLVLDSDALVPVRFVVEAAPAGDVVVDPPEGLFDL